MELALGKHQQVIPELADLAKVHPLRERLIAHLMIALYRAGRQADALAIYRRLRTRLKDELAIEPTHELSSLHMRILQNDEGLLVATQPASTGQGETPRRFLPRDIPDFTGRRDDMERLDEFAKGSAAHTGAVTISAVAGTGGVGKTALAVHWAHCVAPSFPDGQLFLNLRGYDARHPMEPYEAASILLRALDVPRDQVPHNLDEACGLYRATVADKRLIILLDNARSADQVRPLLPAASGSLVLITSRDPLTGLVARDGARRLDLGMLGAGDACVLLSQILCHARTAEEPAAVAELAELCGFLPLALRIAAANLSSRSDTTVETYVAELKTTNRSLSLAVRGDAESSLSTIFERSYVALPPAAQRFFRYVGMIPGPDFTIEAAAAIAGLGVNDASNMLDVLTDAFLVTESASGRYGMHDLIRDYARHLNEMSDRRQDRDQARDRFLDWYAAATDCATAMIRRFDLPVAYPNAAPSVATPTIVTADQALAWLDAECANVLAAMLLAGEEGRMHAAHLAQMLQPFYMKRGLIRDWITALETARDVAVSHGEVSVAAHIVSDLGWAHEIIGDRDTALAHYHHALRAHRQVGDQYGEGKSLEQIGILVRLLGRLDEAISTHMQAIEVARSVGDERREASSQSALSVDLFLAGRHEDALEQAHQALAIEQRSAGLGAQAVHTNLGGIYSRLGRHSEAIEHTQAALAHYRKAGGGIGEAIAMANLALSYSHLGRHDDAIRLGLEAVERANRLSFLDTEASALNTLAEVCARAGQTQAAATAHRRALEIAERIEDAEERERAEAGISAASQRA